MPRGVRGAPAQDLVTRGQQKILQLMAKGRPPGDALVELCRLVDRHCPGSFSSLFAADAEGNAWTLSAAPGMPEALAAVCSRPGAMRDSEAFGASALLAGRPWESEDVANDPGWGDLGPAVRAAGLGAWSALPVFGPDRRVLGAFALGKPEPGAFLDAELGLLHSTVGLASIAFQQLRQQEELLQHAERFRRLAIELPTGVFEADARGSCTFVNEALCELTGLTQAEALGHGWLKAIHPLDRELVREEWTRGLRGGKEFHGKEWRLLRPDGSIRWVTPRVKLIPRHDGPGDSWLGLIHDITGRRELEAALTASERLARSILECAPIGIQVFDAQGNSMTVNQARLDPAMSRRDPPSDKFNVLTDLQAVDPELAALYAAAYRGEVVERPYVELAPVAEGGEEGHFHQLLYPVVDEQRRVTAVVSLSRDISREVRAERALRKEKARFEALVQNALDLIFTVDRRGLLGYVSPSIRTILGFWGHEVEGRSALRILHPADRRLVERAIRAVRSGAAREISLEVRARHKDGTYRWLLARGSDQIANPAVEGMVFNCSDITEIKGLAEEILEREQKLQMVLASTEDASWNWDLTTGIVEHNSRWRQLTGDEDEAHHPVQLWAARVHPDDMAQVMGALNTHFMGKSEQYLAEYRYLHSSGRWIWILDRGKVVSRDAEGRPLLLAGTMAEITSRKEAELALQASEARLRAVVGALPDTYLRLGPQGVLLDAEVHGMLIPAGGSIPLGRPLQDAPFPEALKTRLLEAAVEASRSGHRREFRLAVPGADGERHLDLRLQPGGSGEVLCLIRDITEQHRTEEYLHQTQKLESLGLLAGGIAHDFNNLFQGLMGNLNLAEMQVGGDSPTLPVLRRMEGIVQRAAELTQRLLHYSGKGFFLVKRINLSQALMDMSELLRVSVPKSVSLRLDLAPDLPPVEVDQDQLQQVVLNLVTNSLEALDLLDGQDPDGTGGPRGTITLATKTELVRDPALEGFALEPAAGGLHAVLEVRDDGPGMDAVQLSHCFDPFFTTKRPGRGLGLPASLGILRRHKGGIQVRSAPGSGTTFRIFLPVAQLGEPAITQNLQAKGRILLADDDTVVRQVTGDVLRNLGYEVDEAVDGQDALERFQQDPAGVSLVLLDLVMPRMDGYSTFRAIRALRPSVPVVFISGYSQKEVPMPAEVQGHAGFLQKPFQISKLEELLDEVLRPHMSR